jgi:4-oxalomesaconate tautomerase
MQRKIPCVMMRGGTSRGPYFLRSDLPADAARRDAVLLSVMGSPHALQIDGIGGANSLTSKVAIVSPSSQPGADVDYLFAQVLVDEAAVDTRPNCGNMLAGVGPYAIEQGLVPASSPETLVRIYNVNTRKLIEAIVQTPGGKVTYEGDARIDGVPGAAAPVKLAFLDAKGAVTGKLLPTGNASDRAEGIEVSCVDMAMPMVLARAAAFGRTGYEAPAELDADKDLLAKIERVRRAAALKMGMGDVAGKVVPKFALLAAPRKDGSISSRYFVPYNCHRAHAVTGAICVATACVIPGTVAHAIASPGQGRSRTLGIEHPAGMLTVDLEIGETGGMPDVSRAAIIRTTRRIFEGSVLVPESAYAKS